MTNRRCGSPVDGKPESIMSDKINVAVRIRPLINRETHGGFRRSNWKTQNEECLYQVDASGKMVGNPYSFDVVFEQDRTNEDIFKQIAVPIVDASLAGFHGTIFAYGQTSSGKTYTMSGTPTDTGLIPRSVDRIFNYIDQTYEREYLLRVSYMEIYNEKICDLLAKESKQLAIKENYDGQLYVQNMEEIAVTSKDQLLQLMRQGDLNRRTGETNMNERSSRSHSIFRLVIESQVRGGDGSAIIVSHFNLVDLAGSERVSQTGATGERLREGCHINKSLSTLCLVIYKLSIGEDFVNYRDSKLTRILQGALGGNSRTSIICTVTPASVDETHSTLKFANNAKAIKNKPIVNEVLTDAAMLKRYEHQISKLQSQLTDKSAGKVLSDLEWQSMQEELEKKDEEKKSLAQKIEKLQREVLSSQLPQPGEAFRQKAKRRETCCIGMLPKKNVLTASATDDFDFKRPLSILPIHSARESRAEFVSPDVAFSSLPTFESSDEPVSRRMSFSPPRGRRGVVLFDPMVTTLSPEAGPPGQCDCGLRLEDLEFELEELRDTCENLQSVNEMMVSELEGKKDFSMMEKDQQFLSPAPSMLLSPAPNLRRSLARTLMSPAARSCASPRTTRMSKYMSPTTTRLREQLEVALSERDEARQEIEDLKNFLGVDLDTSNDPNQTTTDVSTLRQQRDVARESLAVKREMLADTQGVVEVLKEGLETCHGSLIQAEQKDRQKYQQQMQNLESERDQLAVRVASLIKELEIIQGERDVLQEAQDSSGSRRRQHEAERDRLLSELESAHAQLLDQERSVDLEDKSSSEELTVMKGQLENKETELTEARGQLENKETELAEARGQLENKETELAGARGQLENRGAELAEARGQLENKETELTEARGQLENKETELTEARGQLENKGTELTEARGQLENKGTELTEARGQLENKETELTEARGQLEDKGTELTEARGQLENKETELTEARGQLENKETELTEARGQLENKETELTEARSAVERLEKQTGLDQEKISSLETARNESLTQITELKTSLEVEQTKLSELVAQVEQLKAMNAEITEQSRTLESSNGEYSEKIFELEKQCSQLCTERETHISGNQNTASICEELRKESREYSEKLLEMEKQCSQLCTERETLISGNQSSARISEELRKQIHELVESQSQTTNERQETSHVTEEKGNADSMREDMLEKSRRLQELESKETELTTSLERSQNELLRQEELIAAGREELSRLENICDSLDKELSEEQSKNEEILGTLESERVKSAELEQLLTAARDRESNDQQKVDELEEAVARYEELIERGKAELDRVEQICDDLDSDLNAAQNHVTELNSQLSSERAVHAETKAKLDSELAKLESLQTQLESKLSENTEILEELASEKTERTKIQDQLDSEKATNADIVDQLAARNQENADIREKLHSIENDGGKEVGQLREELAEQEALIERGREELNRVEKICDELDEELNAENDKVAKLEQRLEQETGKCSTLQSQLDEARLVNERSNGRSNERSNELQQTVEQQEARIEALRQQVSDVEKLRDELLEELSGEREKVSELETRTSTDEGSASEEMKTQLKENELCIEACRAEITRLEKICDELEAELEEELTKTAALEKQVRSQGGKVVLPASGPSSKELESMKRELSAKEISITRHLGEEKRLRTVLDKARQDLVAERKRNETLHQQLQSQIAVGGDGECSREKLMVIENKYKSSLDERTREVMRLKSELRRVSQLQDQTIIQPERRARPAPQSKPGAPCTGSGVTDDIAIYTLEAKNAHLEREMGKLKMENEKIAVKLRDVAQKLAETFTSMYRWKDKAEEWEKKFSSLSTTGEGKENMRTPPQQMHHFLSKAHADPANPLYDLLLDETGVKAESSVPDSPDDCKQS